jgi:hypothetical protein
MMRRLVGLVALAMILAAGCAETQTSSPAAAAGAVADKPAVDPLAGLDRAVKLWEEGLPVGEEERLVQVEKDFKKVIASGWEPTWSGLAPNLTDKQIAAMSSEDLGKACFTSGLPARTVLLYNSRYVAIKRLEIMYKGYAELFARPDCWKAFPATSDFYASQLDPRGKGTDNVNGIMGLAQLPEFYPYPPVRKSLAGHERELIAAHLVALKKISVYLGSPVKSGEAEPFFSANAPYELITWGLALGHRLLPEQYAAACEALRRLPQGDGQSRGDVKKYVDLAIEQLQPFVVKLAPAVAIDKAVIPKAVADLIADLGNEDFKKRQAAEQALVEMGQSAVAGLQAAAKDPDPERSSLAKPAIKTIEERRWGPAVNGVRLGVRADTRSWRADQIPSFLVDIRNDGPRQFLCIVAGQRNCQLAVDGQWYKWPAGLGGGVMPPLLVGQPITDTLITLSPMWEEAVADELEWRQDGFITPEGRKRLELKPGRHTVRVGWIVEPTRVDTGGGFRVIGPPLEIEIKPVAGPQSPTWPASAELTVAVVDLAFKHGLMINEIAHGQDKAEGAKRLAETIQSAETVERLAAKSPPLLPAAKRFRQALLEFREALEKNQPTKTADAAIFAARFELINTLVGAKVLPVD